MRRVIQKENARVRQVVDSEDIGHMLKSERIRRGLSQDQFGELVGLTRQKVHQMESGKPGVAVGTVLRAMEDLGVRLIVVPIMYPGSKKTEDASSPLFEAANALLTEISMGAE